MCIEYFKEPSFLVLLTTYIGIFCAAYKKLEVKTNVAPFVDTASCLRVIGVNCCRSS
jgi:hypothetical protein